jgi:hypothetical protein
MLLPVRTLLFARKFRRRRELPVAGKVIVRKGQNVSADAVIAEAVLGAKYQYLDLGQGLGLVAEEVRPYLQVKIGSRIEAGDLIAGPVGGARRVVRSPAACTILGLEHGRILLESAGEPYLLKAIFPGSVVDLLPDRGAVIESNGILLQGIWGNCQFSQGRLVFLAKTPQHVLAPSQLTPSLAGALVLAGHCENRETLVQASEVAVGGLVLSSLNPLLLDAVAGLTFPVMILEGFGKHPINVGLFQSLSRYQSVEAVLNTEQKLSGRKTNPEILLLAPVSEEPDSGPEMKDAAEGDRVRVISTPYLGKVGTLINVSGSTRLPNGVRAETGRVRLDNGENLDFPLANLEIIEQT